MVGLETFLRLRLRRDIRPFGQHHKLKLAEGLKSH